MDEQGDLKERLTRYADDVAHYEREGDAALVAEAAARISALEGEVEAMASAIVSIASAPLKPVVKGGPCGDLTHRYNSLILAARNVQRKRAVAKEVCDGPA